MSHCIMSSHLTLLYLVMHLIINVSITPTVYNVNFYTLQTTVMLLTFYIITSIDN